MYSQISEASSNQQQKPQFRSELVEKQANLSHNKEQISKKLALVQEELNSIFKVIESTKDIALLSSSIKEYCFVLVGANNEELFINFFAQYKFMELLSKKIKEFKTSSEFLKSVFSLFEFLMKALKRDEELIYFLLKINQEGFISSTYYFQEEEDIAYYANFLKLMVRKINEQQKYLSVFFNLKEPHFPLLLKLLKFYDCTDVVMHTSSKLVIMEISNNKNVSVQKFSKNFPFVIFYPLYVGQILESLKLAVYEDKNEMHLEGLQNHLKYMQDFIANKDREAIDIYTNTFLKMIGLFVYSQLANMTEKTVKRVKKMYKILIKYVIPELSVVKIKTCLLLIFNTDISSKLKKCFSSKPVFMQTQYWLLDECLDEVIQHCKKVHYNNEQQNKSFFKTINSYIPRSKDNWLYYEMRKISDLIGFNVPLGEQINHDSYLNDSFLNALWTMIDDRFEVNEIYSTLMRMKDEELLYYNFKVLINLANCYNNEIKLNMDVIIQQILICNSLSLVQVFYLLVLKNKIHYEESSAIQSAYEAVTEKLTHFIMTLGMKEFLIRVQESRIEQNDNEFFQDIYRQIECEILLFVALRTLLGFPNHEGSVFPFESWENQLNVTAETTFRCHGMCANGPELSVILDGQYVKIKNRNQHLIHREELLLHNIRFYEETSAIILHGNEKIGNYSTTIYLEESIKPYLLKQINSRKNLATKIMLILREMKFQFTY